MYLQNANQINSKLELYVNHSVCQNLSALPNIFKSSQEKFHSNPFALSKNIALDAVHNNNMNF